MTLEKEFSLIAETLKENNKNTIIFNRMIPFLRTYFLNTEGYLKSDLQLYVLAQSMFEAAQENGIIDGLNNVKEKAECNYDGR